MRWFALVALVACHSPAPQSPACPPQPPAPAPVASEPVAPPPPPVAPKPSVTLDCASNECMRPETSVSVAYDADGSGATVLLRLVGPAHLGEDPDGPATLPCTSVLERGAVHVCGIKLRNPVRCETKDGGPDCVVLADELRGDQAPSLTLMTRIHAPLPPSVALQLRWALCDKERCTLDQGTATVTLPPAAQ